MLLSGLIIFIQFCIDCLIILFSNRHFKVKNNCLRVFLGWNSRDASLREEEEEEEVVYTFMCLLQIENAKNRGKGHQRSRVRDDGK